MDLLPCVDKSFLFRISVRVGAKAWRYYTRVLFSTPRIFLFYWGGGFWVLDGTNFMIFNFLNNNMVTYILYIYIYIFVQTNFRMGFILLNTLWSVLNDCIYKLLFRISWRVGAKAWRNYIRINFLPQEYFFLILSGGCWVLDGTQFCDF